MPGAITDSSVGSKAAREQWEADKVFVRSEERVWEALPGIQVPVLVMAGDVDVLVPPENAKRIADRIPGAQLHVFQGWGHGFKCPAQLAEVVNAFMQP